MSIPAEEFDFELLKKISYIQRNLLVFNHGNVIEIKFVSKDVIPDIIYNMEIKKETITSNVKKDNEEARNKLLNLFNNYVSKTFENVVKYDKKITRAFFSSRKLSRTYISRNLASVSVFKNNPGLLNELLNELIKEQIICFDTIDSIALFWLNNVK
jgi:hypothetical protein